MAQGNNVHLCILQNKTQKLYLLLTIFFLNLKKNYTSISRKDIEYLNTADMDD